MLLNLSGVLSEPYRDIQEETVIEMEEISFRNGTFPIVEKAPLSIEVNRIKEHELKITGKGSVTVEIPCDRCLEPVRREIVLDFVKDADLGSVETEQSVETDETDYINGYMLDVDKLVYGEILIGWPTKILCREECKGICGICGQNLNQSGCGCEDAGLDSRMSVIRDIFKNFKEV